jgi:hypothetical protein
MSTKKELQHAVEHVNKVVSIVENCPCDYAVNALLSVAIFTEAALKESHNPNHATADRQKFLIQQVKQVGAVLAKESSLGEAVVVLLTLIDDLAGQLLKSYQEQDKAAKPPKVDRWNKSGLRKAAKLRGFRVIKSGERTSLVDSNNVVVLGDATDEAIMSYLLNDGVRKERALEGVMDVLRRIHMEKPKPTDAEINAVLQKEGYGFYVVEQGAIYERKDTAVKS